MIRWLILTLILFNGGLLCAQSSYTIRVTDGGKKEPVTGCIVRIAGTGIGAATDMDGLAVLRDIPAGKQVVQYQYMGFKARNDTLMFPLGHTDTAVIALEDDNVEMEEVTVSTTRSSRTIQDVPTRIELISGEELDEKANMKPGDIKMLLSESTGIQTLQTSATSGNAGIRFEGMDGRYTQILKDADTSARSEAGRDHQRRIINAVWRRGHCRPDQPDIKDPGQGRGAEIPGERNYRRRAGYQRLLWQIVQ